jgi:hypothetical protein
MAAAVEKHRAGVDVGCFIRNQEQRSMDGLPAGALTDERYLNHPAGLFRCMPAGIGVSSIFRFGRFFSSFRGARKREPGISRNNIEIPGLVLRTIPE